MNYVWIYLAVISLISFILTLHDKRAAKRRAWRVKEQTLLFVAALGGSVAMLLTMLATRHKTKHAKFMAGLPVMILLQVAAVVAVTWWMTQA